MQCATCVAHRLTISQATLGETQETRIVNIDQPISIEAPEAPYPIPFAEIDPTIFDAPSAVEEPPTPPAPFKDHEFASPMFMKRSRASYGPLFDLDLDHELEDDGGRKGKGRKRPRYSALNGKWRLKEDSSSPEPDSLEGMPSAAREQDEDVEMLDTSDRPAMADGGVQTNEFDLAPVPSSPINTPSKTRNGADASIPSHVGVSRQHDAYRTGSGVQASPSRPVVPAPTEKHENLPTQATPHPFGQAPQSTGFAAFGMPQEFSQNQGFGNAPSLFRANEAASSNQSLGGTSSLAGTSSNVPSSQGFGQTPPPFGIAPQTSSLFGMGSAPAQSSFAQIATSNTGFGIASGSLRFGFGQEPQATFDTSPFGTAQPSVQLPADPYPESSLDQQEHSNYPSNVSQNPFIAENSLYGHGFEASLEQTASKDRTPEQGVELWPTGTQNFASSHAIGRIPAAEDLGSDGHDPDGSPSGMIPPATEDGTRNVDEMRQGGILSKPVYRQDVPQEALPDQEDASAGEEDGSIDSDEQAAYDDAEKGDDYDLRNYDRVSDDEEGFEEEEPFSDDELLDEGSEHWGTAEAGYDEVGYDEDDEDEEEYNVYSQAPRLFTQPQLPPQPAAQKDKIVIDLLSDSDDDEPPAPPVKAPRSRIPLQEPAISSKSGADEFSETESMDQHDGAQTGAVLPPHCLAQQNFNSGQEGVDFDEEAKDLEGEDDEYSDEEHSQDNEDESDPGSDLVESDDEEIPEAQEAITVNQATEPYLQPHSFNGAMDVDDDLQDNRPDTEYDETEPSNSHTVNGLNWKDRQPESDSGDVVMAGNEDERENLVESFQTQPDEMLASFQFHVPVSPHSSKSSEIHKASDLGKEDANAQESADSVDNGETRQSASESVAGEDLEKDGSDQEPSEHAELSDVDSKAEAVADAAEEVTAVDNQETQRIDVSMMQQDEPTASPISQHQEGVAFTASIVEISQTTVTNDVETNLSNQPVIFKAQETDLKAELLLSQPVEKRLDPVGHTDSESAVEGKDHEMEDAEEAAGGEGDIEEAGIPQPPMERYDEQGDVVKDRIPSDTIQESPMEEIGSVLSPQVKADVLLDQTADEKQRPFGQEAHRDDDDGFHEASERNEEAQESLVAPAENSFVSTDSQASGAHEGEGAETVPAEKPQRGGRKRRTPLAKSAPASQRAQRQSSRQSSRQVSAQQPPSSQRTTRSKTMSFQAASPKDDKEDISIQLARAALKSPSSKKKKGSVPAAKRVNMDLVKRLENDLPDCVSLSDLRKYNANFVDVAAVAISANVSPKRTPTREYASSFTITDPSFAPDGVVEVDLYSLHKDHLPVVKTGDSVLLRGFLVVSLPGRGFGLKTKDGSAWAVFQAEGDDRPEMNAAVVEMSDKEEKFMLDIRAWYAGLDATAKDKLVVAVEDVVESGKESRAKK